MVRNEVREGLGRMTRKVKRAEERLEKGVEHLVRKRTIEDDGGAAAVGGEEDGDAATGEVTRFRMPPDATLETMTAIAARKLRGVGVRDYYDVAWSDKDKPLYGPFLERQGKDDVSVSPWVAWHADDDAAGSAWCGEAYEERRVVTFAFMKQTIGQTRVEVTHTQRRRREGDDRCVVQIRMAMKGFPYADCFVVHVRHVASRVGDRDLSIKIGMHVQFLKSCMFEKKIRTNTGAETTKAQAALLEMTLERCAPYVRETEGPADDSDDEDIDDPGNAAAARAPETTDARLPVHLPDPVLHALRSAMLALVTLFRTYVRPHVPPALYAPFPPASGEEALRRARAGVRALEETGRRESTATGRSKDELAREIATIKASLDRIEEMSTDRT